METKSTLWRVWWFDSRGLLAGVLLYALKLIGGLLVVGLFTEVLHRQSMSLAALVGSFFWLLLVLGLFCWSFFAPIFGFFLRICSASVEVTTQHPTQGDLYRDASVPASFRIESKLDHRVLQAVSISADTLRGFRLKLIPAEHWVRDWYQVVASVKQSDKPEDLVIFEAMPESYALRLAEWLAVQTHSIVVPPSE